MLAPVLRFRIGRIPVELHSSHLLISAALGFLFARVRFSEAWPAEALSNPETAQSTLLLVTLLWMGIISVSVLVHELGHALVCIAFGYRPSIQLVGMGGLTQPNAGETIPWQKDVLLTLAGPGFGLGLGLLCWVLTGILGVHSEVGHYVLNGFATANLLWAVLNLLPVAPLDGGRIASALLIRMLGRRGFVAAQGLGLAVGGLVALEAIETKAYFMAVLFSLYAARSVSLIAAYFRGEIPDLAPSHPNELALRQAEAHFHAGRLDEAREALAKLLSEAPSPALTGRAHHLLGWLALKEARGREALDHFSQVQGRVHVESQALAAAYSLLGDDERALSFWELAYRDGRDPTVLHEWAGALLRCGKQAEAQKLTGLDWAAAYACAMRVAFLRHEFPLAAKLGEEALETLPSPELAYDTACAYARLGDTEAALRHLVRAAELGFADAEAAADDEDLLALKENAAFSAWLGAVRGKSAPRDIAMT